MGLSKAVTTNILRGLSFAEYLINKAFVSIRSFINATAENTRTLNNADSWEKMYLTEISPVREIQSEITKTILRFTHEGERLLETGCGSGIISAELSIAGRKIAIGDFSQSILDRVGRLFNCSGLPEPEKYFIDLTKKLPFADNQFDVVWNSGVLEHYTEEELQPIVNELARCARRCVISLVPNERSLLYRFGREYAEAHGIAPWGRELPRTSLRSEFERAGLVDIHEETIEPSFIFHFPSILDPVMAKKLRTWWNALPDNDPVKDGQGYLLLTVGYKNTSPVDASHPVG